MSLFPLLLQWCPLHGRYLFPSKVQLIPFFFFSHLLKLLVVTSMLNWIGFFLRFVCTGQASCAYRGHKFHYPPLFLPKCEPDCSQSAASPKE